jgi:lipopolysaccharide heptosyltransferase II
MNTNSILQDRVALEASPILVIPYVWIGDFVRCHSIVRVLRERWPQRPVDMLASSLCAPLIDYMPGVRAGLVCDLPRRRLPLRRYAALARQMRAQRYGACFVMSRTWKAALAPFLAGIPRRTGFVGEGRFLLLNDLRWGERRLERMIDCMGSLALPQGMPLPKEWPLPQLVVPAAELAVWRRWHELENAFRPIVALAPGAVGRGKRWASANYAELAKRLTAAGVTVWVLGGPNETPYAREIAAASGARDLTTDDLRNAIVALTAVDAAVTNDSGLMHVSAALGTATVALFGPTNPRLWAPLNPLAAAIEPQRVRADVRERDVNEIDVGRVFDAVGEALATARQT